MTQKYSDVDPPIAVTVLDPSDPSSGGGKAASDAGYAKAEADMGKYGPDPGLPPIPAGSNRYYCSKCKQHYDLPHGATTWRCSNCQTFNSDLQPDECPCCTVS